MARQLNDNEDAYVPGRWYLFAAPGGFTFVGRYVRPLGMGQHRFKDTAHLLNAGGLYLSQICESGPGPETQFVPAFPGFVQATPLWSSDYYGPTPWGQS